MEVKNTFVCERVNLIIIALFISICSFSQNTDNRTKIRLGFDAPHIDHRQILLTIDEKTTDGVDWGYNAEIYQIFPDDMFWIIDDKKYVIQAINSIKIDKELPLGIHILEDTSMSIKIDKLENVDDSMELYIKDNLTNETFKINDNPFKIYLEAGEYYDRFTLTFQPQLKRVEDIKLIKGFNIYMKNSTSELQLKKIIDVTVESISIHNYKGQTLNSWSTNLDGQFISLPFNAKTGLYIIQIKTSEGSISKKIIKV